VSECDRQIERQTDYAIERCTATKGITFSDDALNEQVSQQNMKTLASYRTKMENVHSSSSSSPPSPSSSSSGCSAVTSPEVN